MGLTPIAVNGLLEIQILSLFPPKFKDLRELCHETAHARQLRVNLKRLAQLFQVLGENRHSEFIALNLGHPRIFF